MMRTWPFIFLSLPVFLTVASAVLAEDRSSSPEAVEFFEKQVRPVLAEHCLECHGPKKQESGLRLDSRAAVLKGGDSGPAIVLGKPDESFLIEAIRHDGEVRMPPAGPLSATAVEALTAWIAQGVAWPEAATPGDTFDPQAAAARHWAFQPVRRPAVPVLEEDDWSQSPIDRFVLQKLRAQGLSPAPRAARETLLRRVTFDLIGLPPTPEELAAFLADDSADAYARLINRLLASPHFGERWGRHWLDVARYADNKGYVFFEDAKFPWAYAYRDYVVRAFNDDLPYDRFVREQLAADQLDLGDERWRLAAMGFLTIGNRFMNNVHDVLDDRIDVVTRGLLGLTVTCARCHDHKFDPVPQADYYSLYGVFRSSVEPTLPPELSPPTDTEERRKFDTEMNARLAKLNEFVHRKHADLVTSARTRAAEYLLAAEAQRDQPPTDDFMLIADPGDLNPSMIVRWQTLLDKTRRRSDPVWAPWHALAELPAESFTSDAAAILEKLRTDADAAVNPLVLEALAAMPISSLNDVAQRYGELLNRIEQQASSAEPLSAEPATVDADPHVAQLRHVFHGPEAPPDVPVVSGWGFLTLLPDRAAQDEYKKLLKEVETWSTTAPGAPPRAMALIDAEPPYEPRVFLRGNPQRLGEPTPRQFLACLDADRAPFTHGSGRRELADAIVSPHNPLTARVIVNRLWLHHFGQGLVATPSDFGLRGEPPTHPELLDWLADELVTGEWSLKRIHRQIVLSSAYQQSSRIFDLRLANSELEVIKQSKIANQKFLDPSNQILGRFNRRRLEFEAMRDALLAVSGSLELRLSGPAVEMFGDGFLPRRTLYGFINRLDTPGLLTTFDFPNPAASSPQRQGTLTAPQSLYLMNSGFLAEAARRFANRPDVTGLASPADRLERMYRIAFARRPTPHEQQLAAEFLGAEPTTEAWEQLAHALLMTNEFVFVD